MATAAQSNRIDTASVGTLHWVGIALAAISGVIHLFLGVSFITTPLGWSFLIAGVGFLGGVAAMLTNTRRRLVVLLGIPFTAGQIVIWYLVNAPEFSALGIGDKVVQALLIVVLIGLYRRG
ncbi:DUF7475 family protein [Halococcus morrhuae DSM 1307]|uniref:Uncharacterized protein n=1 Tax=Halococcus dombrowskii TaxID=179637 RepID=A0AAV3SES3_HALDO|nr:MULTISPECIES: hypothetical protein [Halococcus]UOO95121.1 hypothetical protein MUK72_14280 [Halococcus dombrowskii]